MFTQKLNTAVNNNNNNNPIIYDKDTKVINSDNVFI